MDKNNVNSSNLNELDDDLLDKAVGGKKSHINENYKSKLLLAYGCPTTKYGFPVVDYGLPRPNPVIPKLVLEDDKKDKDKNKEDIKEKQ